MQVKDVMTSEVITVAPSATLKDASRLLVERGISGVPVVDDGRVVGVLSETDFLMKERGRPVSEPRKLLSWFNGPERSTTDRTKSEAEDVAGAMSSPPITVTPTTSVAVAASRMLDANVSRLPVVLGDELVGIVTRADLLRAFVRKDADIEREINAEVLVRHMLLEPTEARASVHDGHVLVTAKRPIDVEIVERLTARVPGVVSVRTEAGAVTVLSKT